MVFAWEGDLRWRVMTFPEAEPEATGWVSPGSVNWAVRASSQTTG